MRRYSEAVKADIRKRMSPPARQSVARISEETGIHICTLYAWRKGWRLEGEVVPASQKDPEGWSAADKFTVVLETAGGDFQETCHSSAAFQAACINGSCPGSLSSSGG